GPTEELLWFVAETDALRRVRPDVSAAVRGRLVAETRRWAMRDLRGGNEAGRGGGPARRAAAGLAGLFERLGEARVEDWGEDVWEAFALQALWRGGGGRRARPPGLQPPPPPPRRRPDPPPSAPPVGAGAPRGRRGAAGVRAAAAAAGAAPRPAPAGDRGGRRPARPRRAHSLLCGLPGPGRGPLAAAAAGRGLLPCLRRAVPPAGRA